MVVEDFRRKGSQKIELGEHLQLEISFGLSVNNIVKFIMQVI